VIHLITIFVIFNFLVQTLKTKTPTATKKAIQMQVQKKN